MPGTKVDRRKHKAALEKTEQTYKDLLANSKSLTDKERSSLEESLATVQSQLRTKEEQTALEKKKLEEEYNTKVADAEKRAQTWEGRFRESQVNREIQDAAVGNDAFRAEQVVSLLRPMSRLVENADETGKLTGTYKVVIDFPDQDESGKRLVKAFTPEEAIRRMKDLPAVYGNLFKANVVSGVGAHSTAGAAAGQGGKVDVRRLAKENPAEFRRLMKENPALLGL